MLQYPTAFRASPPRGAARRRRAARPGHVGLQRATTCPHSPVTLLDSPFLASPSPSLTTAAETQQRPAIAAEQAPPSPSSLVAAKTLPLARPQLRRVLLYLVDRLAEPFVP